MSTDAVELTIRQNTQQASLQVERHVTDLVKKQCAAIGLLEPTTPGGLGAGERATLMAEQFTLEQVLGNRRGVDRDERTVAAGVAARAVLVKCTRDEFLARTRLAGDQHRDIALAESADRAKDVLHRRRLAQHLGHLGVTDVADLFAQALFHRPAYQLDRTRQVKGLGQVLESTALEG